MRRSGRDEVDLDLGMRWGVGLVAVGPGEAKSDEVVHLPGWKSTNNLPVPLPGATKKMTLAGTPDPCFPRTWEVHRPLFLSLQPSKSQRKLQQLRLQLPLQPNQPFQQAATSSNVVHLPPPASQRRFLNSVAAYRAVITSYGLLLNRLFPSFNVFWTP